MLARLLLVIFAGIFLWVGFLYISKPKKIMEFHSILKDFIFNDAYISLNRHRIGSVLILLGVIILAIAWLNR